MEREHRQHEQTSVVPNPDSLDEVRVLQNNYSAPIFPHGFFRRAPADAERHVELPWHRLGVRPQRRPQLQELLLHDDPSYKQNIFGYNIGGPVLDSQALQHQPPEDLLLLLAAVRHPSPGAHESSGHHAYRQPASGHLHLAHQGPATGLNIAPNASGQYVLPANEINPNSVAYVNALYPLPNFANGTTTNFINNKAQITDQRDDEIKIDHNFSPRFHLLGEYLDEYQQFAQNSLNGSQGGEVFPTNSETDLTHNKLAQVSLTQILTPNMVNTTSVAMNIFDLDLNLVGTDLTSQVPGFQTTLPYAGYISNRLPLVTFSGGIAPEGIAAARPLTHAADLDDTIGDDWSFLKGRNFFQAGLTVVFNTKRQNPASATNGQFTFTGSVTAPVKGTAGASTLDDAFADFLVGRANTFTQVSDEIRVPVHAMEVSPYFEDRIKFTKNLTVTAGLRLFHMPLPYGPPNTQTIFSPGAYSLNAAPIVNSDATINTASSPNYNPLNGLLFNSGATGQLPQNFSNAHNWYFGPNFGVAWDVFGDGRTSFRGGYGITYTRVFTGQDCAFNCAVNPPRLQTVNLQNPSFPNPVGTGTARAATNATLSSADLNIQATQIHTYSAGIEHQFPGNWFASVTGASSQARHLLGTWNYNQPLHVGVYDFDPCINPGSINAYAYNPGLTTNANPALVCKTTQLSPYPGYAAISTLTSRQNQNWNAVEASIKHPVAKNLFLTVAYTFSHDLTDFTGGTYSAPDPYHPSRYYGNAEGLNFPHSFSITAIYALPTLSSHGALERLTLGGWKYSDITTLRSGTSLSPGLSISSQGSAIRPDRVPGVSIGGARTRTQWFNTAAFQAPQPGFYGNAATGSIQGPGVEEFDMSLYKDFHITEGNFFEFRAEAFNILNHTNFTTISTNFGASTYGNATAATDPRILEFALRYHF